MPRLYGGDVTTRSTLASARRDIPVMQSCLCRSNLVIQGMSCDCAARTSRKLPKARSISGQHRLPACPFRQPAEKLFDHQYWSSCDASESSASCRRQQASGLCSPEIDIRGLLRIRLSFSMADKPSKLKI